MKSFASDRLDTLLAFMREYHDLYHQWPTTPEMMQKFGVAKVTVVNWLNRLQIQGRLIRRGQHGRPDWEIVDNQQTRHS